MAKIEVGMLVEVIDNPIMRAYMSVTINYIGHKGKVLKLYDIHPKWGERWDIEGTYTEAYCFCNHDLRPINPPKTNQDITETREKGCGDWPFLKELLFNEEKENEKV